MIISAKIFLFLMLVLGIAVLAAAFSINSDISKCKSQLAQNCLRGLFIMGSTIVAIPLTSFIVCPNIDHVGSELTGKLLVLFMFLVGGAVTALASIINAECKEEKSNTVFPIVLGVIITLTCLLYFFSSSFKPLGTTQPAWRVPPVPRVQQPVATQPMEKEESTTTIALREPPKYKCLQKPNGSAECVEYKNGHFSEKETCERNCYPEVDLDSMGTF